MEHFYNFITTILGIAMAGFFTWMKIHKDFKIILSKLNVLTIKVDRVEEDHAKTDFKEKLSIKIDNVANSIIESRLANNVEFKQMIKFTCQTGFNNVINPVMIPDFIESSESVKSRLVSTARIVASSINYNKLFERRFSSIDNDKNLSHAAKESKKKQIIKDFYKSVKTEVIYPAMNIFLKNYEKTILLENGIRRKEFEKIVLQMVRTIVDNSIDKFNIYAQ